MLRAAHSDRYPIPRWQDRGAKYGFIDSAGNEVIPPVYDIVCPFSEGLAAIKKNGKPGWIDTHGNLVLHPPDGVIFCMPFSEGFAHVTWGLSGSTYMRRDGRLLTMRWPACSPFSQGRAFVLVDTGDGQVRGSLIDADGREIAPVRGRGSGFRDGLALAEIDGHYCYIDRSGARPFPQSFFWADNFSEGLAWVQIKPRFGFRRWALIDTSGGFVLPPAPGGRGYPFSQGLSRREQYDGLLHVLRWREGFVDRSGNWVIEPNYRRAADFSEGVAAVQSPKSLWGYVDHQGQMVIEPRFSWTNPFRNGLAQVFFDSDAGHQSGYIDRSGRIVWQGEYPYQPRVPLADPRTPSHSGN